VKKGEGCLFHLDFSDTYGMEYGICHKCLKNPGEKDIFITKFSVRVRVMVFNATFNNISVIQWRLVLLVEETGAPGENHRPAASH
jgi:hypothetical protein